MVFVPLNFSYKEIATSSKQQQMDTNIDEVRKSHKASTSPPSPVAGVEWIDDSVTPWIIKRFDGTQWLPTGYIDPDNHQATGIGPTLLVSPQSVVAGEATLSLQQTGIAGLNAWMIWFEGVIGGNSSGQTYLRFYNNETLISDSNYAYVLDEGSGNTGHLLSRFAVTRAGSAAVFGHIKIWVNANNLAFIDFANISTTGTGHNGYGYYKNALTDIDGFLIGRTAGNFSGGTVSIYKMPQWRHS